jgi:hypothetical protein
LKTNHLATLEPRYLNDNIDPHPLSFQLPYLFWSTPYPVKVKLLIWGIVELCWNTYPSTVWSSGLLHAAHLVSIL